MEIDLTEVVNRVAESNWDSRLLLTGAKPFAELTLMEQNLIKEQILPTVFRTVPIVAQAIKDKIDLQIIWETDAVNNEEAQANLNSIRDEIKNL